MSQPMSFIQNINYLARNIHLLERGEELLTPAAVRALSQALDAPLDKIVEDIKKGVSDRGNRKLDISTADNYTRDPSSVEYSAISITGSDPSLVVRHEFVPSHKPRDILNAVRGAIEAYNVAAEAQETTLISDYDTELVLSTCEEGGHGWLVRITDAADDDSLLSWTLITNVELHVAENSLTSAVAPSIDYYWYKTTSSFLLSTSAVELLSQAVRRTTQQAHEALLSAQASAHSAVESEASRQASEAAQAAAEAAQRDIGTLRQDLANPDMGAAMVGFKLAPVAGAVGRSAHAKLSDYFVSAKDFGAVGDGVTDDTQAAMAGIEYLSSKGGGTLYFPSGDYSLNLVINSLNITILTERGVVFRAANTSSVIRISEDAVGCTIDGPFITGQRKVQEGTSGTTALHCVYNEAQGTTLRNFKTQGARQDGIYSHVSGRCDMLVENFEIDSVARNPVSLIQGVGYIFRNGYMRLDNSFQSAYGNGLYLFDQEPNNIAQFGGEYYFENVRFINAGSIGDNKQVRFCGTNLPRNDLKLHMRACEFVADGPSTSGAATIRLFDVLKTGAEVFRGISIRDSHFEERIFSNAGEWTADIEDSVFDKLYVGTNTTWQHYFGDGCTLCDITSASGSVDVLSKAGARVTLQNVVGNQDVMPKDTRFDKRVVVATHDIMLDGQAATPAQCGRRMFGKALNIGPSPSPLVVMTVGGIGTFGTHQTWEITVTNQVSGSTAAGSQRSQKIVLMLTRGQEGTARLTTIPTAGWPQTLGDGGAGRTPVDMQIQFAINASGEMEMSMIADNNIGSGSHNIYISCDVVGSRINNIVLT